MPTPDQLRGMMQMLQSDPQARQQFMQAMSEQMGLPPTMVNMLMSNMETAIGSMSDDQMNSLLQMGDPFGGEDEEDEGDRDRRGCANDVTRRITIAQRAEFSSTSLTMAMNGSSMCVSRRLMTTLMPMSDCPTPCRKCRPSPEQYPDWERGRKGRMGG